MLFQQRSSPLRLKCLSTCLTYQEPSHHDPTFRAIDHLRFFHTASGFCSPSPVLM